MRYIVNTIVEMIKNNAPDQNGEMMVRIDSFEDIKIYEAIARNLTEELEKKGLSVKIKLAKNRWLYFQKSTGDTTSLQAMEQNHWIADAESITHYRNLHDKQVLILLGTEDEEDKGGLLNCYTITPDILVNDLKGKYYDVFAGRINFSQSDQNIVNKVFKDLFEFEPIDICKLSNILDQWAEQITIIKDFLELFFASLPLWGLPKRKPPLSSLTSKKNILRAEYNFINRQIFKTISVGKYKQYQEQLRTYEENKCEFSSIWDGWKEQNITNYEEFSKILLAYIRGENIEEYKNRLLDTDFEIVESVLGLKIEKEKKEKTSTPVIWGEPLEVFTNALLQMLCKIKELNIEVETVEFEIVQAEIVCMYSEIESTEEKKQLIDTWLTICRHTNGILDFLNRSMWDVNDTVIDIVCKNADIFEPDSAIKNIDSGIVKAAGANKKINKIEFNINCKDSEGNFIKEGRRKIKQSFQWKFNGTDAWLHNFSDICSQEIIDYSEETYIPIGIINKLNSLFFAKSEEEFFDLYDESDLKLDYNLSEYVANHVSEEMKFISAKFIDVGKKFKQFICKVANKGFYACICEAKSALIDVVDAYTKLGEDLVKQSFPENQQWILDAYIHAFNIEMDIQVLSDENTVKCCLVPAWHPATLEKINDQKIFFLDGCKEWWDQKKIGVNTSKINDLIDNLSQMSMLQSTLDIFPSYGQQYFGTKNSFGAFSIYGRNDIENNSRLKDMIHKDAIFDDDFDLNENKKMSENAKMIYGVLIDYLKAFSDAYKNLSIVFIDPSDLQPIIASIYKFIETVKKEGADEKINLNIRILVKPENKGGRNYLAYWMDECFSQDANVTIKTYLNEWNKNQDIKNLINGNNDIVFVMDLLKVNNLHFIRESGAAKLDIDQCRFPIIYKPVPVSDTSINVKRCIELSQPQFKGAYIHTQVVRYRNNLETIPSEKFIAVREVGINHDAQELVYLLHEKAYWVVCIDSGMDGAVLRNDEEHKDEYSIIGFSTGKGLYGQYNLTVTARKSIVETIKKKLEARLYQLFHWENTEINRAANLCLKEASELDGISLLSAINQKDHNINEFMAYILTSFIEKESEINHALKIVIHLDSYKHWFNGKMGKDEDDTKSRPDFLILQVNTLKDEKLKIKATVVECKIASRENERNHKEHAIEQVSHGIKRLSDIFNAESKSIKRRYWYAQLYRALAFAQVTFSDNTREYAELSSKLRAILSGEFEMEWNGKIFGFWLDMEGDEKIISETGQDGIQFYDIPQTYIQKLLLQKEIDDVKYINIEDESLEDEEKQEEQIKEREKEIQDEIEKLSIKEEHDISKEFTFDEETKEKRDVYKSEEEEIKEDIGIEEDKVVEESMDDNEEKTSLEKTRVLIGKDKIKNKVYWEFGNEKLANRHLLITGTSGQGKTYAIQSMLYELSKSQISSVIFDYTEGFRKSQLKKEFVQKMGNHIQERVVKFQNVPINPFKRQYIEFDGENYPEKDSDIAARFSNIMTHVYKFGDQQAAAIFEAVRIGLKKYKDKMNMQYFQKELEIQKQENKSAQSVITKMKPFFYGIEFEEDSDFDWKDVIYSNESKAMIFQLTSIDRDMQVIITELMLWDLWYYSIKNGNKDKPFVVVLDEAQNLSHKSKSPSCKILTEGRKFGWSAWYATQSLKVLDDEEVTRLMNASFKLYFKPTESEVVKMSKQLDPMDGNMWLTALNGLEKGQCIVVGDRVKPDGKLGKVKPVITNVMPFSERR